MDSESKHDASSEVTSKPRNELMMRKKLGDHLSKYSGSRKSSVDTTNTGNVKNIPKIENTFKLAPDDNKRFYAYKIYPNILELVQEKLQLSEKMNSNGYNPKACATLTRELADSIRREAKNLR